MRPTAGLPQFQPPTARGGMNGPGTERMRPGPPALGPRSDNRQPRIQAGDRVNGPPSHEEGPGEEADESATEESTEEDLGERKKIELTIVNIDVFGDVKVTAETHESNVSGKEDFRQRLAEQPCFTQVARRDIGGVVSTGRHADWVKFEVSFKIRCRQDDSASEEGGNP